MTTLPLAGRREVRRWVWTVATTHRTAFVGMLTLFVAATAAELVGPRLLGELVESVRPGGPTSTVDLVAVLFLVALLAATLLRRFADFAAALFGERLLAEAREDLVRHAVALPLDTVERAGTGELLSRATSDVTRLSEGLRMAVPMILVASVSVVLTAVAMVLASPLLAAGALVCVPLLVVAARWYRPRIVPTYQRALTYWARVHASTHETVTSGRTVEALGLASRRIEHQNRALRLYIAAERRGLWLWSVFLVALESAAVLPVVAILLLGGWAYHRGLVGIGEVTATVLYAGQLSEPLNSVLSWMDEMQIGVAALRRVLGVRLVPAEQPDPGAGEPVDRALRLRDVRFGYRAGQEVLRGINLDIVPGTRIAVVGPSGAGKSTLARLLAGINAPTAGSVLLGGVPITALPLERRRREIVLVTQEQHVFAGTLRENLTLAYSASDTALWQALRAVGADRWAQRLPQRLDTPVGDGGEPVPPAVAQQLALARLLLADPHTLVLDEATSLLDPDASGELNRSLAAVLQGRTVITIAHQLQVARAADRIMVLTDGMIAEQGTHDELLATNGHYAALYRVVAGEADLVAPATA